MSSRVPPDAPPVLLVTGAAGGIGGAVVDLAERTGEWTVVSWDVRPAEPTRTRSAVVDAADPAAVTHALDTCEAEHGPVRALVHAAGVLRPDDPLDPDPDTWAELLRVNAVGTAVTCGIVAERMAARGAGAVVGVTSNAASTPRVEMAAYAASKAAAASLLRSLGLRVAGSGVRVNAVSPGSTLTPMLTDVHPGRGADELETAVVAGRPEDFRLGIPLGRVARPTDVAEACLWLASDAARHVTLHDLRVDGGATLDNR